jgi:hypothetical protein
MPGQPAVAQVTDHGLDTWPAGGYGYLNKQTQRKTQTEETTMDANAITAFLGTYNGELVTVTMTNGDTHTGVVTNLNTKGVGFKMSDEDTKTDRLAKTKIASIELLTTSDATDVLTTAELAVIFETNAYALRVQLRKLGLGVGRGSRYGLPRTIVTTHGDAIRTGLATDSAKKNKTA